MPTPPYQNMNFQVVCIIPGLEIVNRAYNASKQTEYVGFAVRGTANGDSKWTIRKYTYTDNQVTSERVAVEVAWDNRASETYS